ncbi:hypothetical protein AM588_10010250 [Phytophthora nicotianae]|uniref:3-hydroxyisobutyrate dehydrogenase n=1 Tax=Phytophthora nicotianae TaxID=4792 RepID=A0A0W8DKT1_PHYNI|nr:hypothetical protein AM588_10010250 [Phytophthora nicotianae]
MSEEMALQQQQTSSYPSLLGKREADTELHEEEHDDEEAEEDPSRLLPVAEEEQALVQCVGIEQCFDSWDDFHRAMEEYCATTHQPMRLRTSDSAKAVNSRAAKRNSLKEPIDESVGFVKKLYLCTHGVKTKPPLFQTQGLDLMSAASRVKIRVGWIGTGIMGASMCGHLMNHGYEVTVYNRTLSKCDGLRGKGARVAGSPAEVAQNSDIVFIMVGYPSDVNGQTEGVSTLDAPVSGGDIGARDATLSIMVGGDMESVYVTMPFLSIMGKSVRHMGPAGAGQHTKMMNQILIATNMIGVVEGLLYAKKSGLDMDEAIRAVSAGAAGSWSISNMGPRIAKRDFDPGFFVEHFLKDMGIALKEAERYAVFITSFARPE